MLMTCVPWYFAGHGSYMQMRPSSWKGGLRARIQSPWMHLHDHCIEFYYSINGMTGSYITVHVYDEVSSDQLTHWGRVTYICVNKLTIIGSDNGLSPGRRQDIIWTNAGILLIGPLGTNFSEKLIEIGIFSFKKMYLKISSAKWRPSCSASMC